VHDIEDTLSGLPVASVLRLWGELCNLTPFEYITAAPWRGNLPDFATRRKHCRLHLLCKPVAAIMMPVDVSVADGVEAAKHVDRLLTCGLPTDQPHCSLVSAAELSGCIPEVTRYRHRLACMHTLQDTCTHAAQSAMPWRPTQAAYFTDAP
jgi:hypothetical protein